MYNIRRLANVARQGLADLLPAAQQAFNDDPTDDRLPLVYGHRGLPWPPAQPSDAAKQALDTESGLASSLELNPETNAEPQTKSHGDPDSAPNTEPHLSPANAKPAPGLSLRNRLIVVALLATVLGNLVAPLAQEFPGVSAVYWPAVILGAFHALVFRSYLFKSGHARRDDFPWLAASLAPALGVLMLSSFVGWLIVGPHESSTIGLFGHVLVSFTHALGVAAALVIAVAALCYSRDWSRALLQLAVRLLVFRIMVWITTLIMLEIGVIGPIIAVLLNSIFGISLPDWISDLTDAISYAVIMSVIYLAVIGGTWTVCRQSFSALLHSGDVDVLKAVASLASAPKRDKKNAGIKDRPDKSDDASPP